MDSDAYWKNREAGQKRKNLQDEKKYRKRIEEIYADMLDEIEKEIDSFYARYAGKEGITMAETKKRVSTRDIEVYGRKAKKYVEEKSISNQANEKMRLYNATVKINRLEMLKAKIGLELVGGFEKLQKYFGEKLTERTMQEFEYQAGILGERNQNSAKLADAIVNTSFQNAAYSDRVWMYQDLIMAELSTLLCTGFIQGQSAGNLTAQLRKRFGISQHNAERLMDTELRRVQTQAAKQSYERNGIEEYKFLTINARGPCGICKALDGKVFKVKDMQIGKNAPPMHPRCHCTMVPYWDEEEFEEWPDYLDKGGTTKEWKRLRTSEKSVEKSGVNGIIKNSKGILEMNLQFFSESDIKKQESNSLKRAIRKYEKRIMEHEGYLKNPEEHCPDWNDKLPCEQEGLKRHWEKEIRNFNQSIQNRIDELKERGDFDE